MQRLIGIILLFIMLSACSQTTETLLPVETLQPTMSSIATETPTNSASTSTCPAETTELKLFTNANDGFCFLYPIEDAPLPPYMVVINPNGISGGDFLPGDALVMVNVEAASGRTAAQVADEKIAEAGDGFNITRSEIMINGKQAVVVDGLPAQDPSREVFIVDNDRLYILFFEPWTPNAEWFSELEKLYSSVIDSFHVFPPPYYKKGKTFLHIKFLQVNASQHSVPEVSRNNALGAGDSGAIPVSFLHLSLFLLSGVPPSAPAPVTQAVGRSVNDGHSGK